MTEHQHRLLDQDGDFQAYRRQYRFSFDRTPMYRGGSTLPDFRNQRPADVEAVIQAALRRQGDTSGTPVVFRGTVLNPQAQEWHPQPASRSRASSGVPSVHSRNVSGQQVSLSRSTSGQLSTHSRQASGQQGGRSRAGSTLQTTQGGESALDPTAEEYRPPGQ